MKSAIQKGPIRRGRVLIEKRFARALLLVLLTGWAGMAFSAGNTVSWVTVSDSRNKNRPKLDVEWASYVIS